MAIRQRKDLWLKQIQVIQLDSDLSIQSKPLLKPPPKRISTGPSSRRSKLEEENKPKFMIRHTSSQRQRTLEKQLSEITMPSLLPRPNDRNKNQMHQLQNTISVPSAPCKLFNLIYLLRAAIEQTIIKPLTFKYINTIRSVETLTLYKGYRSITSNSLLLIHYSILPSKYLKQVLLKFRSNHILALLLPNNLKLNVISIDLFDFIITTTPNQVFMPYSSTKLTNTLGLDLSSFTSKLNINNIIYINYLPNIPTYTKEHFQQKIPIVQQFKGTIYCFFGQELTLSLSSKIIKFIGSNQSNTFKQLPIEDVINESISNSFQLREDEENFKEMEKKKNEIKQRWRKQEDECLGSEKRIEKQQHIKYLLNNNIRLRNEMVERIKQMSGNQKISNMHFLIGDIIVRNVSFFRNQDENSFYRERRQYEICKYLNEIKDRQVKKKLEINEIKINQSEYILVYYLE